jgi:biotin carboxyl carrier protein
VKVIARVGDREIVLEVSRTEGGHAVAIAGRDGVALAHGTGPFRTIALDGRAAEASAWRTSRPGLAGDPQTWDVSVGGRIYAVRLADPLRPGEAAGGAVAGGGPAEIRAVMPGKVVAILAPEGREVQAGQGLVVVEAMKMENEIAAPRAGRVVSVKVQAGEAVEAGSILVVLGPPAEGS